jgi:CheY-like chemotaxis protein
MTAPPLLSVAPEALVAHELRSPLTAVAGYLELLLDTPLTDAQHYLATTVSKCVSGLLDTVDRTLELAHVNATPASRDGSFNAQHIMADVCELHALEAQRRRLALFSDCDPSLFGLELSGNPVPIRQLLNNLVSNALKATSTGHVTVRARLLSAQLEFCVEDTGPGLSQSVHQRLNAPWAPQGEFSLESHGLGLRLVREFARRIDATLAFESKQSGTCVRVQFPVDVKRRDALPRLELAVALLDHYQPRAEVRMAALRHLGATVEPWDTAPHEWPVLADVTDPQTETALTRQPHRRFVIVGPPQSGGSTTSAAHLHRAERLESVIEALQSPESLPTVRSRQRRALVADDFEPNRKLFARALTSFGYHVTLAENGEEAITQAVGSTFDAVICDIEMPRANGLDVIAELRRLESIADRGRARIVAVSAYSTATFHAEALERGADVWLDKPVRLEQLREALGIASWPALVLDDDPVQREILRRLLENTGFGPVACFDDVRQAIDVLPLLQPRIAFIDHRLGDTDGQTALARLIEAGLSSTCYTVALSAHSPSELAQQLGESSFHRLVSKPLSRDQAVELRQCSANRSSTGSALWVRPTAGLEDIAAQFLVGRRQGIAEIEAALAQGNLQPAIRFGHDVFGAAGALGLASISAAGKAVENGARKGSLAETREAFRLLSSLLRSTELA